MLKIEADINGSYRAESTITPMNPLFVLLRDKRFGELFSCVGSSERLHPPSNLFKGYGQIVQCGRDNCNLIYHIPPGKVEMLHYWFF